VRSVAISVSELSERYKLLFQQLFSARRLKSKALLTDKKYILKNFFLCVYRLRGRVEPVGRDANHAVEGRLFPAHQFGRLGRANDRLNSLLKLEEKMGI
jgi:hypothetical protein